MKALGGQTFRRNYDHINLFNGCKLLSPVTDGYRIGAFKKKVDEKYSSVAARHLAGGF